MAPVHVVKDGKAEAAPAENGPLLQCPSCQSTDIARNPKQRSSYCRCQACGQMWHPDRMPPTYRNNRW